MKTKTYQLRITPDLLFGNFELSEYNAEYIEILSTWKTDKNEFMVTIRSHEFPEYILSGDRPYLEAKIYITEKTDVFKKKMAKMEFYR